MFKRNSRSSGPAPGQADAGWTPGQLAAQAQEVDLGDALPPANPFPPQAGPYAQQGAYPSSPGQAGPYQDQQGAYPSSPGQQGPYPPSPGQYPQQGFYPPADGQGQYYAAAGQGQYPPSGQGQYGSPQGGSYGSPPGPGGPYASPPGQGQGPYASPQGQGSYAGSQAAYSPNASGQFSSPPPAPPGASAASAYSGLPAHLTPTFQSPQPLPQQGPAIPSYSQLQPGVQYRSYSAGVMETSSPRSPGGPPGMSYQTYQAAGSYGNRSPTANQPQAGGNYPNPDPYDGSFETQTLLPVEVSLPYGPPVQMNVMQAISPGRPMYGTPPRSGPGSVAEQPLQPLQPLRPLQPLQSNTMQVLAPDSPAPAPLDPPSPLMMADWAAVSAAASGPAPPGSQSDGAPVEAASQAVLAAAAPPPLLPPSASAKLREVASDGRPFVVDTSTQLVYRDASQAGVLERVGKWVKGKIVFIPQISEVDFYSTLRAFLVRRQLGLAELFAALDADLDGCLSTAELRALMGHVVPGATPSEVAYLTALIDWDDDGFVGLADLLDADELAAEVADERGDGAASPWARALQETSFVLHSQRKHAAVVFRTLAAEAAVAAGKSPPELYTPRNSSPRGSPRSGPSRASLAPSSPRTGTASGTGTGPWSHPGPGPDGGGPVILLEPAQLLRFLRIMRPELGAGEVRYIMDHLLQGPGDNRRSLGQVLHMLHLIDVAYSADQTNGVQQKRQAERHRAEAEAVEEAIEELEAAAEAHAEARAGAGPGSKLGSRAGSKRGSQGGSREGSKAGSQAAVVPEGEQLTEEERAAAAVAALEQDKAQRRLRAARGINTIRPPPLAPSRLRRRFGSPRENVPRFFYHLGYYMRTARLTLRELMRIFDSDGDGGLDPLDVRHLINEVLPGTTTDQVIYIRAAISSPTAAIVTMEDLHRGIRDFGDEFSCGRQDAAAAANGEPPCSPLAPLYLRKHPQLAGVGRAARAEAEEYRRRQREAEKAMLQPPDILRWITEYMARRKISLALLLAQFDRDCDGMLNAAEAARLLRFVAAGRLGGRQRSLDKCLARFMAEADGDRDGALSYNDLRRALLAKQELIARDRAQLSADEAAERVAATTAAVLLGPADPAMPATLTHPNPYSQPYSMDLYDAPYGFDPYDYDPAYMDENGPFWAPEPGGVGWGRHHEQRGHRTVTYSAAYPAGIEQYPGMMPPGTAVEDYDTTPYMPARPTDAHDPFTLAFAAENPRASRLPESMVDLFPGPAPVGPGGGPGGGGVLYLSPAAAAAAEAAVDLPLCDVEDLDPDVTLYPVDYMGTRMLVDRVSNLAFLPLPPDAAGPGPGGVARLGRQPRQPASPHLIQQQAPQEEHLHLFGRLLPNGTLERVETPLAAALFAALDNHLRDTKRRLEDVWAATVGAVRPPPYAGPGSLPPPPPPEPELADANGLARFLRPLLPNLTLPQLHYLLVLFDLDGDGLVAPDDLVLAFEEIGTTIDTPANKLHAQAYKVLARIAGAVMGDYAEAYQAFARYSELGRLQRQALAEPPTPPSVPALPSTSSSSTSFSSSSSSSSSSVSTASSPRSGPVTPRSPKEPKDKGKDHHHPHHHKGQGQEDGQSRHKQHKQPKNRPYFSPPPAPPTRASPGAVASLSRSDKVELSLPQLARFASHLLLHKAAPEDVGAVVVYLNMKLAAADGGPQPPAAQAASLPGPNQPYGNPYGNPHPYKSLRDAPPAFDWPFVVGVLRLVETSLPVNRRLPSPSASRRTTAEVQPMPGPVPGYPGVQGAEVPPEELYPPKPPPDRIKGPEGLEAAAAAMKAMAAEGAEDGDDDASRGLLPRPSPLRTSALTSQPAPHPDRRVVDLHFYVHTDGRTFLLDPITGLLYIASPYILAAAAAAADAAEAAATGIQPPPSGGANRKLAAALASQRAGLLLSPRLLQAPVKSPTGKGGKPPAVATSAPPPPQPPPPPPPLLLLPYPELAGKLQYPDNRLLPAQSGAGVTIICKAVARLAAEEARVEALFKMLDRDGQGLDGRRLAQLFAGTASLTAAEVALARVLLDRDGRGLVTLGDVLEASQKIHYTAVVAGTSPGPAPPVTLTLSRLEARTLDVLHRGAQALQREGRLLWLLVQREGMPGGLLDKAAAAAILREVLEPYLPPYEVAVVLTYLWMVMPDKDGPLPADEMLQLLRSLPMRIKLPYSPYGAQEAPTAAAAAGAAGLGGKEVVFAAGFGGPVAQDGTLPAIQPPSANGVGGGRQRYRRHLGEPTGPTWAEPEVLYGPNDGAKRYDPNLVPYDPDWGEGPYGLAAASVAGGPRPTRIGPGFLGKGPPAAARQDASEAAGQYGLYDDDVPEVYEPQQPYDATYDRRPGAEDSFSLDEQTGRMQPRPVQPRQRAASRFLSPRETRELDVSMDAVGPADRLPQRRPGGLRPRGAGAAREDSFSLEAQAGGGGRGGGGVSGSMSLAEETDLMDVLRGRPPGRRQPPGLDSDSQYGLLTDTLDPARPLEPGGLAGRQARLAIPRPAPPPAEPPGRLPRPGAPPRRQSSTSGAGGGGFDPYGLEAEADVAASEPSDRSFQERPTAMHTSPSYSGGRPAEVLSFLDQAGDGGGRGSGGRIGAGVAVTDSYDPYGMHGEDDVVNAGSVPPSRPDTAAPSMARESTDMPRLASPLLNGAGSGFGGGVGPGGPRPITASRLSTSSQGLGASGGAGFGSGLDDTYGDVVDSPAIAASRRQPSTSGGPGGDSASGPALFTSFGDALDGGRSGGGPGGDGFGLGSEAAGAGLPPPGSFKPPGRSRLSRTGASEYDPYGDEADDQPSELPTPSPLGAGGAGGGGGMFNASIRSQASAKDRLGTSIRSAADRYGGGGPGATSGLESSGSSTGLGGRGRGAGGQGGGGGGGGNSDEFGLGAEGSTGGGGARSPGAAGGGGAGGDEGLIDYDDAGVGGDGEDEIDYGLGAEGGEDDF
ncbi:hypothetical protein HYH03_003520 [Edaphochlamys debaryana]|uniref:EF-hand domain-containing protein n=1 Tax=Edaphochlamys debaryana TaxID=47281 RepID=A0A835YA19_9CHLO|nr:hypothetical protein HYH03_003520 [Edaphochlamys debaryana]|eukprot:KAG2498781.1 hypothetical protein HYH03_003520 [Edaphochlamys debaryana]